MNQLMMPIKVKPFEHQKRAFEFVMHQFENSSGGRRFLLRWVVARV